MAQTMMALEPNEECRDTYVACKFSIAAGAESLRCRPVGFDSVAEVFEAALPRECGIKPLLVQDNGGAGVIEVQHLLYATRTGGGDVHKGGVAVFAPLFNL